MKARETDVRNHLLSCRQYSVCSQDTAIEVFGFSAPVWSNNVNRTDDLNDDWTMHRRIERRTVRVPELPHSAQWIISSAIPSAFFSSSPRQKLQTPIGLAIFCAKETMRRTEHELESYLLLIVRRRRWALFATGTGSIRWRERSSITWAFGYHRSVVSQIIEKVRHLQYSILFNNDNSEQRSSWQTQFDDSSSVEHWYARWYFVEELCTNIRFFHRNLVVLSSKEREIVFRELLTHTWSFGSALYQSLRKTRALSSVDDHVWATSLTEFRSLAIVESVMHLR